MKVFELKQLIAENRKVAKAMVEKAESENREMTPEESQAFADLNNTVESLKSRVAALESVGGDEAPVEEETPARSTKPISFESRTFSAQVDTKKPKQYFLTRAIAQLGDRNGNRRLDGYEAEVSQELANRRGKLPQGFYMPLNFANPLGDPHQTRALTTSTGSGAVPSILDASLIDLLRPKIKVVALGATLIEASGGTFKLPRQNAGASVYWVAESGSPTTSNLTIDQVTFTPKTIGMTTDISRQFALEANQDGEMLVRNDFAKGMALGVDLGAIAGSGSSNQPTGALNHSSVTTIAMGTNGLAPDYNTFVDMEQTVATANADEGSLGFLVNPKLRAKLKKTAKIGTTFPEYIWERDNTLVGYRAEVSTQVPSDLTKGSSSGVCSAAIFGDWSSMVIATWSEVDVIVDPYSGSTSGTVRVVALQNVDIQLRHPESFVRVLDFLTA